MVLGPLGRGAAARVGGGAARSGGARSGGARSGRGAREGDEIGGGGRGARSGRSGGAGGAGADELVEQVMDAFSQFIEARNEHNENAVLESWAEMEGEVANEGQSMIMQEGAEGYIGHALSALNRGVFSAAGPDDLKIDDDKYRATEGIWEVGSNYLESVGKFPMEINDFLETEF